MGVSDQPLLLPTLTILSAFVFVWVLLSQNNYGQGVDFEERLSVVVSHAANNSSGLRGADDSDDGDVRDINFDALSSSSDYSVEELKSLDRVLRRAQFRNKTVILTTLNQAWAANNSMINIFMNSFRNGIEISHLLHHLVIVALDNPSFNRCLQLHEHCFQLNTSGVDFSGPEKHFMTQDYLTMMWRRIHFLRVVLQLGYNFVFSDADILWFRDPFNRFHPAADFEIASDHFVGVETDLSNFPNGGFVHATSSNKTIELYKLWYEARLTFPGRHDQDVFNNIKFTPSFSALNLELRFLSTQFFGGFCEKATNLELVCTMHANCCPGGLDNKLKDLQLVVEDWKLFKCMTDDQRQKYTIEWRAPRNC